MILSPVFCCAGPSAFAYLFDLKRIDWDRFLLCKRSPKCQQQNAGYSRRNPHIVSLMCVGHGLSARVCRDLCVCVCQCERDRVKQ